MASLALGVAGAALGSAFGPLGASIGWTLGAALGNALFPEKQYGPKLDDLKLHNSSYGQVTPWLWGTMRVPGNIIEEQEKLTPHEETSGGKGGPEIVNTTYTCSFAARICKGPIAGVDKVWFSGRTVYDVTGTNAVGADLPMTVYLGTEDQLPDPTLEAIHGVGNVPAYRGTAYVVFTDLPLASEGNTLPVVNFLPRTKGHTNSQIRIYKENLATGFSFTQDFSGFFGDYPYKNYPAIVDWPLSSGNVSIAAVDFTGFQTSPVTSYTPVEIFDAATLAFVDHDAAPAALVQPWAVDYGAGHTNYNLLGLYRVTDVLTTPLWWRRGVVTGSGFDPPIGDQFMTAYGDNTHLIGTDYAASWGVTLGEIVETVALTAAGDRLLVFTSPSGTPPGGSGITKWYEVRANTVSRSGTVSPALDASAIGSPGPNQTTLVGCNSIESNGRYLWAIQGMNGGFAGTAKVFEIDPVTLNFAQNAVCGSCSCGVTDGTHIGTAFSMQDGYCGWAGGDNLIVFTRFPEGDTLRVRLSEIVSDLSLEDGAGLTADDIDVTDLTDFVDGYLVTQQATAREMIQPLRDRYAFDAVEEDDVVKFRHRHGTPDVIIPEDDLAAHVDGEQAPPIAGLVRAQDLDLPATVSIDYVDPARDYQTGTQTARRQVTNSQSAVSLSLPISMPASDAKATAEMQLYMAEVERNRYTLFTSRKYWKYGPTDVIGVGSKAIRITDKTEVRAGVIKFDGVAASEAVLVQPGLGVPGIDFTSSPPTPPSSLAVTTALLLDIPLVNDDDTPIGYYAAMAGGTGWPGAKLMKSTDGGTTYGEVASSAAAAVIGTASDVLTPFYGGNIFDEGGVATVVLTSGELASTTELAVLNGANEAILGDEVIQFKNAELVDDDTYELTGLLRGRLGTEWAMDSHAIGERFALLPVLRVPDQFSELNRTRDFKPVTFGGSIASTTAQGFTDTGASLRPYSPVLLGGGTDGSGNVALHWTRRTRIGGSWAGTSGLPLSETSEVYVVQIWNADYSQCARIIETTTPSATYSSADQVTDFGADQQTIYFTVGQVGSAGLGTQARGTAVGDGASDDDPIAPISPYQSPTSGSSDPPPVADALNLTLNWASPGNVRTYTELAGNFACGETVVAAFTTPAGTSANVGSISAVEWNSGTGPVMRTACLSSIPGDFSGNDLGPGSRVVSTSVTIQFTVGPNSRPYPTPELASGTTYYLNIKNDDGFGSCTCFVGDCDMVIELRKPTGL